MYPWLHPGPLAISTYSLCFLCAYAVGGYLTYREAQRQRRATEVMLFVALGALGGGMVGAKLSMLVFLGPGTFVHDLSRLWYSGQAWTGGFFGGYIGVLLVKRWNGVSYSTGDIFAVGLPLAQAIGRLGNLLGGDPFGLPSNLPWALVQHGVRRQPSAAYELILDLVLFLVVWHLRDRMPHPGDLFKLYVVLYCCARLGVDFTRADMRVLGDLTVVQLVYLPTILWFGYQLWKSYQVMQEGRQSVPDVAVQGV